MQHLPGFVSASIHKSFDRTKVINYAQWRSQADLDASVEAIRGSDDVAAVTALVEAFEMVELELLGGKGPAS